MGLTPRAPGSDSAPEGLHPVAERLYSGEPGIFVAERTAAAKAARASGDRALAAAITALRRPTLSAWYVNVAARASLVSLREWLGLGEELREAQAGLAAARVRELSGRRTRLEARVVADLVAHLGALKVTASPAALDEVRTTLRAALSDPEAAAAVASGRLVHPLSYGVFGEVDLSAALAAMAAAPSGSEPDATEPDATEAGASGPEPEASEPAPTGPSPELLAARDAALAEVEQAEATLTDAQADVAAAERDLRLATTRRSRAEKALERARGALASAEHALTDG